MRSINIPISLAVFNSSSYKIVNKRNLTLLSPLATISNGRNAHTYNITKNIYYITNENEKIITDRKTMKCKKASDKPVCIILNWLLGTHKQVMKYANIYLDEGFDVIRVSCEPWQLIWPRKGAQIIARDLINFMAANDNSYVVHGFSVGGYVWSEAMVLSLKNKDLYQPALDRVEAQIWDSVTDITELPVGLPLALFPNNKLGQYATRFLINFYRRAFYMMSTRHYERACETYYATPCRAPALFLLSSVDPVGNEARIRRAYNLWLEMGIQSTWKCWPNSAHVMHYLSNPEEYTTLVRTHIRNNVFALRSGAPPTSRTFENENMKARI